MLFLLADARGELLALAGEAGFGLLVVLPGFFEGGFLGFKLGGGFTRGGFERGDLLLALGEIFGLRGKIAGTELQSCWLLGVELRLLGVELGLLAVDLIFLGFEFLLGFGQFAQTVGGEGDLLLVDGLFGIERGAGFGEFAVALADALFKRACCSERPCWPVSRFLRWASRASAAWRTPASSEAILASRAESCWV